MGGKKGAGFSYNAQLMGELATFVSGVLKVPLDVMRDPLSRGLVEANARAVAIAVARAQYPHWEPKEIASYFRRDAAIAVLSIRRVSNAVENATDTLLARDTLRICRSLKIEQARLITTR